MGICDDVNRKTESSIILGAAAGSAVGVLVLAEGGVVAIESALMGGLIVGIATSVIYYGSTCNFNFFECTGSSVGGAICGAAGSLEGLLGSLFSSAKEDN